MALFRIKSDLAEQVFALPAHPDKEKGLQRLIEKNLEPLFGVRFIATEFATGQRHKGRIDSLGLDQDGSPVIVEYKLTNNDNVMNQGLFYLDWLMDHRGDFEMAARARLGEVEVVWSGPRLILLASSFNRYDQYAVNRIDERIELWTYTLYDGDLLSVDLLSSEEVPSPSKIKPNATVPKVGRKSQEATVEERPGPKETYDLQHHLAKMSPTTQALFELLKEGITDLGDDVTERYMNQYVGYRRLKNFCEVVGQRGKLNVFIDGPVQDRESIGSDMTSKGHWGTGDLRVEVSSEDDIVPALDLIKQAYALQQ